MSRVQTVLQTAIATGVGLVGAASGFTHTHDAAELSGQHGWMSWADAVVIECMAFVALLEIKRRKSGGKSLVFPLSVLVVAVCLQMTSQVFQAQPTPQGWLFASVPAVAFLVIGKMVLGAVPAPIASNALSNRVDLVASEAVLTPELHTFTPALPASIEVPVTPSMAWLPVVVRERITTVVRETYQLGRPVTVDDLKPVAQSPEQVVVSLVHEINAALAK